MRYTKEQEEKLRRLYLDEKWSVEDISNEMNLSTRSIVTKLSLMRIYVRRQYRDKTGERPISKSELVEQIAPYLNMPVEVMSSLEKANKTILKRILDKLQETSPEIENLEELD